MYKYYVFFNELEHHVLILLKSLLNQQIMHKYMIICLKPLMAFLTHTLL